MNNSTLFLTNDVPQADDLNKVLAAVDAVYAGAVTEFEIAEGLGITPRQARNYRHAAQVLGFLTNERNHAETTPAGADLANSPKEERSQKLREAITANPLFGQVLVFIGGSVDGVSEVALIEFLLSLIDEEPSLALKTTMSRRVRTILSWLEYTSLISEQEDKFFLDENAPQNADESTPAESVYPANYSQEVDIKEERFSAFELLRKIDQGKIIMNPDFQRNLVWKPFQQSQFIESIILNVPLPPFYFRKELDGRYIIVDGLQRTSTLKKFMSRNPEEQFSLSGLKALPDLVPNSFSDLSDELKTRIEDKNLLVYVLQPSVPMVVVYDIFNRINTGGTKLERQEIRNCIFIGQATTLLKRLADLPIFKASIDNGISPNRMKDREAILRCLAFSLLDYRTAYNNSMDEFLERAMKRLNNISASQLLDLETDFVRALETTYSFFQSRNFRLPTGYSRGRVNIAIMETVMNFFMANPDSLLQENRQAVIDNYYNRLLNDSEYLDAIRISTGTTSRVITRFSKAHQILSQYD